MTHGMRCFHGVAYRCTIHRRKGETPAMMTLGYEMCPPFDTQLSLSEQVVLEVNPFMAKKMLLLNDTLR